MHRLSTAVALIGLSGAQAFLQLSGFNIRRQALLTASPVDDDSASAIGAACSRETSRREVLWAAAMAAASSFAVPAALAVDPPPRSLRPLVYEIKWTDPPQMQPLTQRGERRIIAECSQQPAVVLGTHGNSEDAPLTAKFMKQFAENAGGRGMVVALACVAATATAQQALDAFVNRYEPNAAIAEAALKDSLELCGSSSSDSGVSFETAVLPVCKVAREVGGMRVAAVGVSDEVALVVQAKGLEGLGARYGDFVPDPKGFAEAVAAPGFKRYSDLVVGDLFEQAFGDPALEPNPKLNPNKVTLANFFAARILLDEGVAQQALAAAKASSGALLVLVADVGRVKFGFGVPARLQRAAQPVDRAAPPVEVRTIILNPTAAESLAHQGDPSLRLALGYGEELATSKPLANYLFFSSSPPPKLLTRMLNSMS